MSKLDEVKEMLRAPCGAELSNADIAKDVGCDEGLVRKARPLVEVEMLREENARLKEELGRFRRAEPGRTRRPKSDGFAPLWEQIVNGQPTSMIPMLEGHA